MTCMSCHRFFGKKKMQAHIFDQKAIKMNTNIVFNDSNVHDAVLLQKCKFHYIIIMIIFIRSL